MNWLAHIFLSKQDIDFQMGNYLADPLKAKVWPSASKNLIQGVQTHIIIDSFTDSHKIFITSKNRLKEKGLLKSIVVDITYDYFLWKHWNKYCNIAFDDFTDLFYLNVQRRLNTLPLNAQEALKKILRYRLLNNYQSLHDLQLAFKRIDLRLSQKLLARDTTSSYFKAVKENINELESDFLVFFPQLCEKVKENIDINELPHWKI